ncbi:MAG: hypothetical protein C5B53_08570 [Candidatus Melainabacteria bacterium]|nr:MAG: hypothetical protein C5B53_08570 [Candidatus Melainabacteria bacterium]
MPVNEMDRRCSRSNNADLAKLWKCESLQARFGSISNKTTTSKLALGWLANIVLDESFDHGLYDTARGIGPIFRVIVAARRKALQKQSNRNRFSTAGQQSSPSSGENIVETVS